MHKPVPWVALMVVAAEARPGIRPPIMPSGSAIAAPAAEAPLKKPRLDSVPKSKSGSQRLHISHSDEGALGRR
ncbi:hypothetical protein GCM10025795_24650 [Verticiella sediminum]